MIKMRKLLIYSVLISLFFKVNASNADTIKHTLGGCLSEDCTDIPEEFYFSFIGDTLVFSGIIFANSCGEHFLICSIDSDTINFNRLDTGELCRCHCLYNFEAKIPGCHLNEYRVILTEYYDNGLDTAIIRSFSSGPDTIQHTLGSCIAENCIDIPEEFNFNFLGDTLVFSGTIFANSCGEHFLIYSIDSDTIHFNRLDTGELCKCHCLYNFEAKIPGCYLNQYQVILTEYFDNGLDTAIIRSFSSGPDTIQHTLGGCVSEDCMDIPEEFNFNFVGNTLVFSGTIFANSCGEHFLIYSIDSDTIHFNRLDTGEGCFCHCLYDFNAIIPGCHLNKYRVILTEYFDNGLDTIIYKNALGISKQSWIKDGRIKISPNPFNSVTTIEINSATELIGNILIYDYLGRIVRNEKSINSKEYEFYRMNLNDGIYFYLINTNINNLYTGRIIVK